MLPAYFHVTHMSTPYSSYPKLKPPSPQERPRSKSGNALPTMGSTSVMKRFAKCSDGFGRKHAYPRSEGGKASNSPPCVLRKQRMAGRVNRTVIPFLL